MQKSNEINSGKRFVEKKIKSAVPIWTACVVWIIFSMFLPMYKLSVIILTAVVSLLVYAFASVLAPKKVIRKAIPFSSGDPELDETVNRIDDSMEIIDTCRKKVCEEKPDVADNVSVILSYILKIRKLMIDDPQLIKKTSRFLNYYLPTTVKISEKYVHLLSQRSTGENVTGAILSMENAFGQIRDAFIKQHDALFADDALDITTDISVLETLLKQDSLETTPYNSQPKL